MGGPPRWRQIGAIGLIATLGIATFAVHAYNFETHSFAAVATVFGVAIPMAVSLSLVGCAVWLSRAAVADHASRVAGWSFVGAAVLVAVTAAQFVFQRVAGGTIEDGTVVIAVQLSVGALLGFILGVYDAQRLAATGDLLDERETADRLSRRLNVLNRVLRHDIRNAVNVIRGNAALIAGGSGDAETAAETIKAQAGALHRLSEQAREIEAALAEEQLGTEPVEIGAMVSAKVLGLRREHPYATIDSDVATEAVAEANPLVDSAIDHLLGNAIEHNDSPEPFVFVEAWVDDDRLESEAVVVRVTDDGPGIPPAEVDVLERGEETALEHASGLGLWVVNWIVSESDGVVRFDERDPRGSVVEVALPRAAPASA
mgnify:CR=1 FL=1